MGMMASNAQVRVADRVMKSLQSDEIIDVDAQLVIYQLSLQGGRHDVRISRQISELGLSADKWGNDAELHHQMCHEEDRPLVKAALEHSYDTGALFQCEYRINTFVGTPHWFRDKARIVMDKYGHPLYMLGVMMDITNIRALETELMQYRYILDKMVRQRTERLNRRVAILESCNSRLSDNVGRVRQMYFDLLAKVNADGAEKETTRIA